MEHPFWTNEEILAELQGLNVTELVNFGSGQLLTGSGTTLLCFVHGNVNEDKVHIVFNIIITTKGHFLTFDKSLIG